MSQSAKRLLKKVPFIHKTWIFFNQISNLNRRLTYLEQRVHNYRWFAIEQAADYLVGAQIEGDYCEFGVYKGDTFAHMLRYHEVFPSMRYFAFDSFEGLPAPTGIDNADGYASNFHEGEFSCNEESFIKNLRDKELPLNNVITIKGWFNQTLNGQTASKYKLDKIAMAWIDCDYYESTVPVLDFLTTRISVGTLIVFDDWKVYRNLSDRGEQKACAEWLQKNPGLKLAEIYDFAHHGRAFTVAELPK